MNSLILESQASETLLAFLLRSLSGWKRGTVKDRLSRGAIRVNGEVVRRHDHRLQSGDRVEVLPSRMAPTAGDERAGIRLLYGDAHIVVIDKPAGLLSVATPLEHEMTAMRQTRLLLEERGSGHGRRLWAVHRLDQETSGALMMARSQAVQHYFRNHWKQVEKLYLAIVENPPAAQSGRFDARLREGEDRKVRVVRGTKMSKAALTHFRTVKRSGRYGLLEVVLLTGRKHQIRVHLSSAGHPVVGDPLYGSGHDPLGRLALHSHRLAFTHPITQEKITVVSPLPARMARFVRGWKTPQIQSMIDKTVKGTAYIGIGSNSDPEDNLRRCLRLLREHVIVRNVSAVYETEACGKTAGGARYLNAAIAVETGLPPADFERRVLKEIESLLGRSRADRERVVIDLDLLAYSESHAEEVRWLCPPESLELAHVMVPLADIAPGLRHPVTRRSLRLSAQPLRGVAGINARPDLQLGNET